jgi:hypothetical protein
MKNTFLGADQKNPIQESIRSLFFLMATVLLTPGWLLWLTVAMPTQAWYPATSEGFARVGDF